MGDPGTSILNNVVGPTINKSIDSVVDKGINKMMGKPKTLTPPPMPVYNPNAPGGMAAHNLNMQKYKNDMQIHTQQQNQVNQQHQNKVQNVARTVTNPIKPYMGVSKPRGGRGGNLPFQQLDKAIRGKPGSLGDIIMGPRRRASLVAEKAVSLMPYINDSYATETSETKLLIAFDAAYELLVNEEVQKKSPGGGGTKKIVTAEYIFDKIKPEAWQTWIKSLAHDNPAVFGRIAHNRNKSLELAKKMAYGN